MKKFLLVSILMGSLIFVAACGSSAAEETDSILETSQFVEGETTVEDVVMEEMATEKLETVEATMGKVATEEAITEETETEEVATEETSTEETETEKVETEEATTAENATGEKSYEPDGYYASVMSGTDTGVLSMYVTGDELHIEGTFGYDETDAAMAESEYFEYYFEEKEDVREYVFLLTEDTQFIATGGDADSSYDREIFTDSYCTQPDLGLGLIITVESSVVTKVVTAS